MFTIAAFQDLYRHLEWAEARVWTAALGSDAAVADPELRDRLQHIHLTQRAFLDVWTGQRVGRYQELQFRSLRDLYAWAWPYYAAVAAFLNSATTERLSTPTSVPWARYFAEERGGAVGTTTLAETLFQVTAHSAYHRGQVNTRLRALGVTPPLVDYIAWLWLERPAAQWPSAV
jgi:uncharacterized damage-inducible protein DinB